MVLPLVGEYVAAFFETLQVLLGGSFFLENAQFKVVRFGEYLKILGVKIESIPLQTPVPFGSLLSDKSF
jgi:hypothetical protein